MKNRLGNYLKPVYSAVSGRTGKSQIIWSRYLSLSLLFIFIFSACKKDEEDSFIDELVSSYTGQMVEFTCAIPQIEGGLVPATVDIAKVSETMVSVMIKNTTETLFDFQGTITSDSTFMIEPFTIGLETFNGIGKKTDRLEIFLGDGCILFGTEVVTDRFTEN